MGGLGDLVTKIPPWLVGTFPAWSMLILILGYIFHQWVKNRPIMEQQKIDERLQIKTGYKDTIQRLQDQVDRCHKESRQREKELQNEIDELKERINGEALQRVQSEISLVNTLIQVVDAPQLKAILKALEERQIRLFHMTRLELETAMRAEADDGKK